jgi:hypothetical protein
MPCCAKLARLLFLEAALFFQKVFQFCVLLVMAMENYLKVCMQIDLN